MRLVPLTAGAEGRAELRPTVALGIFALAFTPDNRRLAGTDRGGVHLWDLDGVAAPRYIAEFGVWDVSVRRARSPMMIRWTGAAHIVYFRGMWLTSGMPVSMRPRSRAA